MSEENIISDTEKTTDDNGSSIEFDVNIDSNILYDYLINHAYTGTSGLIGTCMGAIGIIVFLCTHYTLYLIFGMVLIVYLPINLKFRSAQIVQYNDVYKKPFHYKFDKDGITVSQDDQATTAGWDSVTKVVSTKQSIVVYTGKNNGSILPRKQLGDELPAVISVIAEYVEPSKMRIKY